MSEINIKRYSISTTQSRKNISWQELYNILLLVSNLKFVCAGLNCLLFHPSTVHYFTVKLYSKMYLIHCISLTVTGAYDINCITVYQRYVLPPLLLLLWRTSCASFFLNFQTYFCRCISKVRHCKG